MGKIPPYIWKKTQEDEEQHLLACKKAHVPCIVISDEKKRLLPFHITLSLCMKGMLANQFYRIQKKY